MNKADLKLDWCSYAAAKYAVEHWHYSKKMPRSKLIRIGAWEAREFIGVVIFGVGATPELPKPFGVTKWQACELVRIALRPHDVPVSRIVRIALQMLTQSNPGLRVVVSFADSSRGHHGGIYQAGNWFYLGPSRADYICVGGLIVHPRVLHLRYGVGGQSIPWLRKHVDSKATRTRQWDKYKYAYPLDDNMRRQLERSAKPYPKRAGSIASDAAADQAAEGGATPTSALCNA